MALKKHHKWLIGSFSSLILIFMLTTSVFMYIIFIKQEYNYQVLNQKITDSQIDTQSKINELAENLIQTNEILNDELGSLSQEFSVLKASAGEDFSGIIENSIKSVVTIRTSAGFQGTGFIISDEGYLVTNAHVLADGSGNLASYFVLSFSLKDIFLYDLEKKNLSFIFVSLIPLIIYLLVTFFDLADFVSVLGIGGVISAGLTGGLILLMNLNAKKTGNRNPEFSVPINWLIIGILSLIFILGVFVELF